MTIIDINENKEVLSLAEMLYENYSADAIPFTVNALRKVIEFLNELYPNTPKDEQDKMIQVLKLEIITKFCLYAESLAAIAITFTSSYDNVKKEKIGLFNKIIEYNVNLVVDFYENVQNRENQYFAKLSGYPPLDLQQKQTKYTLELSCSTIKTELKKISDLYIEFRLLYNAYKHGYRVFFGKNEKSDDVFAFIDKGGKQKAVIVSRKDFNEITRSIRHIQRVLQIISHNHRERAEYEMGIKTRVNLKTLRAPNTPPIADWGTGVFYPTRGDRLKHEAKEGDIVYLQFKGDLEKNHYGKIVALDIDAQKIIAVNENMESLITKIIESNSSGRKRIRRIGQDDKTGIEIY